MKRLDLTNKVFGDWLVKGISHERGKSRNQVKWHCVCICGGEKSVSTESLRAGSSKSCGCLAKKLKINETHGMSFSRIYRIHRHMKSRCYNKNVDMYYAYGERGITVCNEWMDFNNFHNWAIENGYTEELTIDRIDNDKGYFPDNCRWATLLEQQRNKRYNVLTMSKAREIRRLHAEGARNKDLSLQFNTSRSNISDVTNCKTWQEFIKD